MTPLEKALRYFIIAGIFALPFVPLIVTSSMFFPFITGKNFTFRILVELLAGAWLALAFVDAKYRPRKEWILAAFAVFIVSIAISDALGANPFKSFWSNYERMDGWVTIAHIFVYLVVASIVINSEKLWRVLLQTTLGVSFFLSISGFLQISGISILGATSASGLNARIDATFGNPIYLAVYMLFHVFIAALLWVQMYTMRAPGKRTWYAVYYGTVAACDTLALFLTGTRGTMIGLAIGAGLTAALLVLFSSSPKIKRNGIIGIGVIVLLSALLWSARETTFVKSVGFLQRLSSISVTDTTIASRFINAHIALQGVKERPLFGWGQENYAIVFDKYYDPRMYVDEPWFDRVHDVLFDWLVAGGIAGLLTYLSVFVATLWTLWRPNKGNASAFTLPEKSIFTGLLAGYFFHNLTVFDNVTSYILFGTILAYIVWRSAGASASPVVVANPVIDKSNLPIVAIIAALITCGVVWWVNVPAYEENITLLAALERQPSITDNLALLKQAISYGTYGTQEAREQLAQSASQIASAPSVDTATKQQFYKTAVDEMTLQAHMSPLDARNPLFIGTIMDSYGNYKGAAEALLAAHNLSPNKQTILFQVALNQQAQGNGIAAEGYFKQAFDLEPDYLQARIFYAVSAIENKDDVVADALLAPIISTGEAANQQIAAAYASRNLYAKLIPIWTAYVAANPTNLQGRLTLAAAYYQGGDKNGAVDALQAALVAIPSAVGQINPLIQQVKAGTVNTH